MDSAKCWLRRLRVSTELVAVLALALAQSAGAQPEHTNERGAAALQSFLSGVRSLTADFKQELYGADEHLLETQAGKLSLQRPNRFRWTYAKPTELIVVADGKKLWMYDVDLAQVTVSPLDDTVGSSPAMLLSGDRDVRERVRRRGELHARRARVGEARAEDGRGRLPVGHDRLRRHRAAAARARRRAESGDAHLARRTSPSIPISPDSVFEFKPPAGRRRDRR